MFVTHRAQVEQQSDVFYSQRTYFVSSEHSPQTDENDLSFEINVHFVKFGKIFRSSEVRVNDLSLDLPARGVLQDGGQDVGAVFALFDDLMTRGKIRNQVPEGLTSTPRSSTPGSTHFCTALTWIFSQQLLHKMTNSRAVLIARIHAC